MNNPLIFKSPETLDEFAVEFDFCWACAAKDRPTVWQGGLQIHHWAGGRYGRSDIRHNLIRVCVKCHELAGSYIHRQANGLVVPTLTRGACLWLKKLHDPDFWDPKILEKLTRQSLPEIEPPDSYYLDQYRTRRPWEFR